MKHVFAVVFALAFAAGCSVRMDTHLRGSLLRHDAQEQGMAEADAVVLARVWLEGGTSPERVIALLIARGIDGTEAERIAALAAGK